MIFVTSQSMGKLWRQDAASDYVTTLHSVSRSLLKFQAAFESVKKWRLQVDWNQCSDATFLSEIFLNNCLSYINVKCPVTVSERAVKAIQQV